MERQETHDAPPEQGCTPLRVDHVLAGSSFTAGPPRGGRLLVSWFRREVDGTVLGRAWFGPDSEGPPGHAHGGNISGVLDEAMAIAAWLAGRPSVAAQLSVAFRTMLPVGTNARLEADVVAQEGRKIRTRARLLAEDGTPYAEAEGLFVALRGAPADTGRPNP